MCDSGASLSFVDARLTEVLNLTGRPVDLNVGGIHETSDVSSKRLRVKFEDQDRNIMEDIMSYRMLHHP